MIEKLKEQEVFLLEAIKTRRDILVKVAKNKLAREKKEFQGEKKDDEEKKEEKKDEKKEEEDKSKEGLKDYNNMLLRNATEKEHPYKEEIRQFKELEAVNSEEQLLAKIKEDFKVAIQEGRLTHASATIIRVIMEGSRMDMLQCVEHILHNQVDLMVKVNNLRHLVKWNDNKATQLFAVAYGRFVIKMKDPLLWEEVEAGKTANTTMLNSLRADMQTLTGGGNGGPGRRFFKHGGLGENEKKKYTMPSDVLNAINRTDALRGSGYKVYVGEDGGVVLDDMEVAFQTLHHSVNTLATRVVENENITQRLQQALQQAQQQLGYGVPNNSNRSNSPSRNGVCYFCGKTGHIQRNCWARNQQMNGPNNNNHNNYTGGNNNYNGGNNGGNNTNGGGNNNNNNGSNNGSRRSPSTASRGGKN